MRTILVVGLFLSVAISGCFGGDAPPPNSGDPQATTGNIAGTVTDGSAPLNGVYVRLGLDQDHRITNAQGTFQFSDLAPGQYSLTAMVNDTELRQSSLVTVFAGETTSVDFVLASEETPDDDEIPLGFFDCGGTVVAEPTATFGHDDSFHGLTWAALKSGFRFAVALPDADGATLTYSVDGGAEVTVDQSSQAAPFFVIDVLPPTAVTGESVICFRSTVGGEYGPLHAARLANGPTSWDDASERYTINMFVYAAEQPRKEIIVDGMDLYAPWMWDMTDGHIQSGIVFVNFDSAANAPATLEPCNTPVIGFNTQLACDNMFDLYFTYQENPLAAGSTSRRGIEQPYSVIRMNQQTDGLPFFPSDASEIGKVTLHEMGHYGMDLDDYYASLAGGPDCYDETTSISVMGSTRAATELDDENHRCPNESFLEADGEEYIPSWTLLRGMYPNIPERTVIDDGPEGDGGFSRTVVLDWS